MRQLIGLKLSFLTISSRLFVKALATLEAASVTSGIPQGFALGPLLFLPLLIICQIVLNLASYLSFVSR